eukprot:137930-Hanusia_phi.AAC.1
MLDGISSLFPYAARVRMSGWSQLGASDVPSGLIATRGSDTSSRSLLKRMRNDSRWRLVTPGLAVPCSPVATSSPRLLASSFRRGRREIFAFRVTTGWTDVTLKWFYLWNNLDVPLTIPFVYR